MEHKTLEATATVTDQGEFTAIAAAYTVDRVNDQIMPGAFKDTIGRWQQSGKLIPLHWNHKGDAHNIIGSINPATMQETQDGLYVEGRLDLQTSDTAKEAWRSIKNGTMSLSFGYLVDDGKKNSAGVNELHNIDLFEISIVPNPANADTRILSTKTADELREQADRVERENEEAGFEGLVPEQEVADDINVKARIEETQDARAALELFEPDEITGLKAGILKAVWSAMMMNDLPDSAFLYVEPGGTKDTDGKTTPRNLRHFPYKGPDGTVDLPHLRNALARIPQSNLSQDVKDRLTVKAQRILDSSKSADVTDKEPETVRSVDTLRRQADATELEFLSDGVPSKSPKRVEQPKPEPQLELRDLKRRMRDEILVHLSGDTT